MIEGVPRSVLGRWQTKFLVWLLASAFSRAGLAQNLQLVQPSQTDVNITQFNNDHYIYLNTNVIARQQLFVFLPGTGGAPANYREVVKTAANLGFHAIGLMYENPLTMNSLCGDSTNPDCYAQARLAVINGGTNAQISIANADSITNRLVKLIEYLSANTIDQNWSQYLGAQSKLDWPNIVIAGHSQGAGHASLIGKMYPVARSLMFSDTDWWTPDGHLPGQPANWILSAGITPDEFYFGFVHVQDPLIPYAEIIPTWNAYGLGQFGGPVLVEGSREPYSGSHMLTTGLPPQYGNYHGATVADAATPPAVDGVTPVYQPVWQFMMSGPPELPQLQIAPLNPGQMQITFGTYTHYIYQMQTTTNPSSGWSNIGTAINGNGTQMKISFDRSVAPQFYRVSVQY